MADVSRPTLSCEALCAGWGETQVISNISLVLPPGDILIVLGRNGVGKSTLLASIIGRATYREGRIIAFGRSIEALPVYERIKLGIGYVPQEREIFPSLSVEENLVVATRVIADAKSPWSFERVLDLFPRLRERLRNSGQQLSGGEQQMLSIGRALMGNPSLLLLDEPMEGLAPVIIEQLTAALHRLRTESDISILLVEQHVDLALELSSRVIVLDRGRIVYNNGEGNSPPDRRRIEDLAGIGDHD
jgi:branched-chain amino acid transport system ATP-binding protein